MSYFTVMFILSDSVIDLCESKVLNDLGSEVRTISENLQTEIEDLKKQQHGSLQSHADGIMGLSRYFKEQMSKVF